MNERSREALLTEFGSLFSSMNEEARLAFVVDMWLTLGASRDHLKERLAGLLANQFGRSSEKASDAQLVLFAKVMEVVTAMAADPAPDADGADTDAFAQAAAILEQTDEDVRNRKEELRAQRKADREARREAKKLEEASADGATPPWPTHLPVREHTLPVGDAHRDCDDCGEERAVIRYETSWCIEYSTTAEVVVTHRPVVACRSHHGGPVTEPVPPKPVDGGQLGFSVASRLLWLRVTHNLPVARIAEMMRAERVPVSETMIHRLIEVTGERLVPLVEAIQHQVQQAVLVNLDDTPVDVYEDTGERRRTRRRARVWLALGDERFAYFFSTRTWKADEAERALGPITGVMQGDGYKGFEAYATRHDVTLAGCMAHLRRKFQRALQAHDPRAELPMALIQGLYRVEELARLRDLDAEGRLALRRERSEPLFLALVKWATEIEQERIEVGSPLGKAWTYLSNQLLPLQAFLTDGHVSIDNNAAERGLRRITIGRKLWLFFRGQAKLEHVSRLMSLAYTARLHGVDELAYIQWVLKELARREWSSDAAVALLPDAWMARQEQETEEVDAA